MKRTLSIVALMILMMFSFINGRAEEQEYRLSQLNWLTGCWLDEKEGRMREENWTRAAGGMMMGTGRLIKNEQIVEFEFMRIHQEKDGIFFTAKPSSQPEASFKLIKLTGDEALFENLQHDFPKYITYRHLADGSLLVRIAGPYDENYRRFDFPFKRVNCQ